MRILFLGSYPSDPNRPLTGPERATISLVRGVAELTDHKVFVILPIRFRKPYARIKSISTGNATILNAHVKDIFRIIRDIHPQVIHVSGVSYFGALAVLLSRLYFKKIRTVYFVHGILDEESKHGESFPLFDKLCDRVIIKYATVLVAASKIARLIVIRNYQCNPERVKVIPYGIDTDLIKERVFDNQLFRKEFGIVEKHIILFIARLVPLKGLHLLVEACMKLPFTDYKLVVIGNKSNYWNSLANKYQDYFAKHVVRLDTMNSERLALAYSSCSLLVLPSRYEPFGLVALEAMAFKKPAIVSDKVGMGYLIDSRINGVIVPFGDHSALVEALIYILKNDEVGRKIGDQARQTAVATSVFNQVSRFVELYNNLVSAQ